MQYGVMISNGSPRHRPLYWAETTARSISDLIEIDESSGSDEAIMARRDKRQFEEALFKALEPPHKAIQDYEGRVAGPERLLEPIDPDHHGEGRRIVDDALKAVVEAASVSETFAKHFAKPEVADVVRLTLRNHFATAMDIERVVHADANPTEHSKAWKTARQNHGAGHAHAFVHLYKGT